MGKRQGIKRVIVRTKNNCILMMVKSHLQRLLLNKSFFKSYRIGNFNISLDIICGLLSKKLQNVLCM